MTDQQAKRLADAYNLGIKADALREFADHLNATLPVPAARLVARMARETAQDLDAQAEDIAVANTPAAPAEPTPEQAHADVPPAMTIADSDGDMWLVCRRCHRRLKSIEDETGLEALVLAARQHDCPERADTPEADRG